LPVPGKKEFELLRDRAERELLGNILPFWTERAVDREHGGFFGKIANNLTVSKDADKGLILNARLLWTFARLYRHYRQTHFARLAHRAHAYLTNHFMDPEYGGAYWTVDWEGRPVDDKKKIYGQAFAVYALAEYGLACDDSGSVKQARTIFSLIEEHAHDRAHKGYFEAGNRDWTLAEDQRLSDADMDEKKSMNTHLHLLEAYAGLLRIWDDPLLRNRLAELINVLLDCVLDPRTHHFRLFFNEQWNSRSARISFGHDIEGSWLLCEAAEVLGDPRLSKQVKSCAVSMVQAVLREAVDTDGGILYEADPSGIVNDDKEWWPQAEAVVGFLNAYVLTQDAVYFEAAVRTWDFIETTIVDRQHGEWFWKVSREGVPSQEKFKMDAWKCPYHNSRCCLEVIERTDRLLHSMQTV